MDGHFLIGARAGKLVVLDKVEGTGFLRAAPSVGTEVPIEVWAAADELFRAAIRLGGTLTGEHGIGTLKSRWLAEELGEDQWELQRQITRVFDPAGILNPGKVLTP